MLAGGILKIGWSLVLAGEILKAGWNLMVAGGSSSYNVTGHIGNV